MPPKNGDIRSFFARSSQASDVASQTTSTTTTTTVSREQTQAPASSCIVVRTEASQPADSTTIARDATPPPSLHDMDDDLRSSPPSIARPRQTTARNVVIAGSDDEEDGFGSDDSDDLPDVFDIGGPRRSAPLRKSSRNHKSNNVLATPRRPRSGPAMDTFLSSPLTIQSKKRKFDLAELLRIDGEDKAAQSFVEKMAEEEAKRQARNEASVEHDDDNADIDEGEALEKLQKVAQDTVAAGAANKDEVDQTAMTTQVSRVLVQSSGKNSRPGYLFFDESATSEGRGLTVENPFPVDKAEGAWAILAEKEDRTRHFQSGLPYEIQGWYQMPDELFLWILDEVCYETRRDVAAEYVNLLGLCEEQMRRLVTPAVMQKCFRHLGASKDVEKLASPIKVKKDVGEPYQSRNWTCLEKFLCLLETVAGFLQLDTLITTMQILLRLGMDRIAVENFGLAQEWRWTMDMIARSVPEDEWTNFCQEVCSSVFKSTEKARLRYQAIAALGPVQKPESSSSLQYRTLDLKRRLASVFFFNEPALADKRPEATVTIRAIIDRLEEDEFVINRQTNYIELTALIMMLSTALGDASRDAVATTPERSHDFDTEVDELADGMMSMLTRVLPQSHGIRVECMEARTAMEMVRERLLYQVRTRKKPRITGILLHEKGSGEARYLPQQQGFMKGFLKKGKAGGGDMGKAGVKRELMA